MPRFHILTTGIKVPPSAQSPSTARPTKFEKSPDVRGNSQASLEIPAVEEPKPTWDHEKASKRKSRLNTSLHLAPKMEISPSDRTIVFKEGYLTTPQAKPKDQKRYYYTIKNGMMHQHADEKEADEIPLRSIELANSLVRLDESKKILTIMLLEEDKMERFECVDEEELQAWAKIILHISYRWGIVQKTEMEHEIAGMRKQLGQLWDLCVDGIVPAKIQKRINDVTMELEMKDSVMADVIARQDELSIKEINSRKPKKVDLFPDEETLPTKKNSEDDYNTMTQSSLNDGDEMRQSTVTSSESNSERGPETEGSSPISETNEDDVISPKEPEQPTTVVDVPVQATATSSVAISEPLPFAVVPPLVDKVQNEDANSGKVNESAESDKVSCNVAILEPLRGAVVPPAVDKVQKEDANSGKLNENVELDKVSSNVAILEPLPVALVPPVVDERQNEDGKLNESAESDKVTNEMVLELIQETRMSISRKNSRDFSARKNSLASLEAMRGKSTEVINEDIELKLPLPEKVPSVKELDQIFESCIDSLEGRSRRSSRRPSNARRSHESITVNDKRRPSFREKSNFVITKSEDTDGVDSFIEDSYGVKDGPSDIKTSSVDDSKQKEVVPKTEEADRVSLVQTSSNRDIQQQIGNTIQNPSIPISVEPSSKNQNNPHLSGDAIDNQTAPIPVLTNPESTTHLPPTSNPEEKIASQTNLTQTTKSKDDAKELNTFNYEAPPITPKLRRLPAKAAAPCLKRRTESQKNLLAESESKEPEERPDVKDIPNENTSSQKVAPALLTKAGSLKSLPQLPPAPHLKGKSDSQTNLARVLKSNEALHQPIETDDSMNNDSPKVAPRLPVKEASHHTPPRLKEKTGSQINLATESDSRDSVERSDLKDRPIENASAQKVAPDLLTKAGSLKSLPQLPPAPHLKGKSDSQTNLARVLKSNEALHKTTDADESMNSDSPKVAPRLPIKEAPQLLPPKLKGKTGSQNNLVTESQSKDPEERPDVKDTPMESTSSQKVAPALLTKAGSLKSLPQLPPAPHLKGKSDSQTNLARVLKSNEVLDQPIDADESMNNDSPKVAPRLPVKEAPQLLPPKLKGKTGSQNNLVTESQSKELKESFDSKDKSNESLTQKISSPLLTKAVSNKSIAQLPTAPHIKEKADSSTNVAQKLTSTADLAIVNPVKEMINLNPNSDQELVKDIANVDVTRKSGNDKSVSVDTSEAFSADPESSKPVLDKPKEIPSPEAPVLSSKTPNMKAAPKLPDAPKLQKESPIQQNEAIVPTTKKAPVLSNIKTVGSKPESQVPPTPKALETNTSGGITSPSILLSPVPKENSLPPAPVLPSKTANTKVAPQLPVAPKLAPKKAEGKASEVKELPNNESKDTEVPPSEKQFPKAPVLPSSNTAKLKAAPQLPIAPKKEEGKTLEVQELPNNESKDIESQPKEKQLPKAPVLPSSNTAKLKAAPQLPTAPKLNTKDESQKTHAVTVSGDKSDLDSAANTPRTTAPVEQADLKQAPVLNKIPLKTPIANAAPVLPKKKT